MEAIDPKFPKLGDEAVKELQAARASLCGG
jgi:hypothetical protein